MQKFALEKSKFFPYFAWATIIGFGIFVYSLAVNLQAAANDLKLATENIESMMIQGATPTTTPTKRGKI